jgi:uncharacterized protein YraI
MSFEKIAASAIILTLFSAGCATAKPIVTTADTNLRKSPGTDSAVLTLIPKGTTVEIGKCSNGWCQAALNGQDGYVIAQNVGMATARRAPRGPEIVEDEIYEEGPPPAYGPAYVVGPPATDITVDGDTGAVGDDAGSTADVTPASVKLASDEAEDAPLRYFRTQITRTTDAVLERRRPGSRISSSRISMLLSASIS